MDDKYGGITQQILEYVQYWKDQRYRLLEEPVWQPAYAQFMGNVDSPYIRRWKAEEGFKWRSKVHIHLTRRKVITGISQLESIMYQGGDFPYSLGATPMPESPQAPYLLEQFGGPMPKEEIERRAAMMKRVIDDDFEESDADTEILNGLFELALYGSWWIQAPMIKHIKSIGFTGRNYDIFNTGGYQNTRFDMKESLKQVVTLGSPSIWEMFWDMENQNPQLGQGIARCRKMSKWELRRCVKERGYDSKAVESIIESCGSSKVPEKSKTDLHEGPHKNELINRHRNIDVIEFWGLLDSKYLKAKGSEYRWKEAKYSTGPETEISCIIAGDFGGGEDRKGQTSVVREPKPNMLPGGLRPYHRGVWEAIPHSGVATGMAFSMKDSASLADSMWRCWLDCKAISSNVMTAGHSGKFKKGANPRMNRPGHHLELKSHVRDVREAVQYFQPTDASQGILDGLEVVMQMADEESGVSKLLQGEVPVNKAQTATETMQLYEAANKFLMKIIRNIDRQLIEPAMRSIYWFQMLVNPDENIKGDFGVKATGFSKYNSIMKKQASLAWISNFAGQNPEARLAVKWIENLRAGAEAGDLQVDDLIKSDEELAKEGHELQLVLQALEAQGFIITPPGQEGQGQIGAGGNR